MTFAFCYSPSGFVNVKQNKQNFDEDESICSLFFTKAWKDNFQKFFLYDCEFKSRKKKLKISFFDLDVDTSTWCLLLLFDSVAFFCLLFFHLSTLPLFLKSFESPSFLPLFNSLESIKIGSIWWWDCQTENFHK